MIKLVMPIQVLMFKNDSGDEPYAICVLDDDSFEWTEMREIVKNNVGDDYDEDHDELYGEYWIEIVRELASDLS